VFGAHRKLKCKRWINKLKISRAFCQKTGEITRILPLFLFDSRWLFVPKTSRDIGVYSLPVGGGYSLLYVSKILGFKQLAFKPKA